MAEYYIGGKRVEVDDSDNPSSDELGRRIEEALLSTQTMEVASQTTSDKTDSVETEDKGYTVSEHISEIPSAIAEGAAKAVHNTSKLFTRGMDSITGDRYGKATRWINDSLGGGYTHFTEEGMRWSAEVDTDPEDFKEVLNVRTGTGDFVSGVSQFVTGFALTRGVGKAAGAGTGVKQSIGYGVAGEQIAFDPHEARLSNLIEEYPALQNPVTDYLSADPEDSEAEARFKMTLEALGLEGAAGVVFAGVRKVNRARKGLKADPTDEQALKDYMDAQAVNFNVSLDELDGKLAKAVKAEADLRDTYKAADAKAHVLTPEAVAGIKAGARKAEVEAFDPALKTDGADEHGFGVTKTNDELVRQADDVLAEFFVDGASVAQTLKSLNDSMNLKDFDVYFTAAGRLLQLNTRNMALAHQGLTKIKLNAAKKLEVLKAQGGISPAKLDELAGELQQGIVTHRNKYRQVQADYIEAIKAFRGGGKTAGRAVQVNKLFQNFDAPPHIVEQHFDELIHSMPSDKARNSFVARALLMMEKSGKKSLKVLDELFITNILTGVKTHVVNTVGNTAYGLTLPLERLVASGYKVAAGDLKGAGRMARGAIQQYAGMRHALRESASLAGNAYKTAEAKLDSYSTWENQAQSTIIGRDLPIDKKTLAELGKWMRRKESEITLLDVLGTTMRAASGRALTMEDEFFKNMNFRSHVWSNSYMDALDEAKAMGLTGKEAKTHAKEFAQNSVDRAAAEQLRLKEVGAPTEIGIEPYRGDALQHAREATFTQDLGAKSKKFQEAVATIPLGRQLFPFVRTPLNLISAAVQRSPLALVSGRWWKDFRAGGERRALAVTRLAVGTSVFATWMADFAESEAEFVKSDSIQVRGAGPTSLGRRRNAQELAGVIYGSVRLPDGTQFQISRWDPFSTIFEGIGTIQDLHREGKVEEADNLILAYGIAVARMFANDTYASTVRQVMQSMESEKGMNKFLMQRTQQLRPWSGLMKGFSADNEFNRELRSYTDAMIADLPILHDRLAPKYNLLGEPVENIKYAQLGFLPEFVAQLASPIMTGKVKTDPVAIEVLNLDLATSKQSSTILGGRIDLHNERFAENAMGEPLYEDNRTAYDRFNEILGRGELFGDMTLREFLEQEITGGVYQNDLTDDIRIETPQGVKKSSVYQGSRKAVITAIIADAKKFALLKLRKENQNLNEAMLLQEERNELALTKDGQQQLVNEIPVDLNSPLTKNFR